MNAFVFGDMKAEFRRSSVAGRIVCLMILSAMGVLGAEKLSTPPNVEAAVGTTNSPRARIVFGKPEFDFGKVVAGTIVNHVFEFKNEGNIPLLISKVHSTCGCTTSSNWSKVIDPGKTGTIPVEFHTGHFDGPVMKPIMVSCNDSNQAEVTLQMHGTVWRPLKVVPESAAFSGQYDFSTNNSKVVRILNTQDKPITIGIPESSRREFNAQIKTNQPGKEYELVVTLVPPLGAGHVFGNVTIKTSSPEMPVLTVPVWALAQLRK